jgi:hypothetical protein
VDASSLRRLLSRALLGLARDANFLRGLLLPGLQDAVSGRRAGAAVLQREAAGGAPSRLEALAFWLSWVRAQALDRGVGGLRVSRWLLDRVRLWPGAAQGKASAGVSPSVLASDFGRSVLDDPSLAECRPQDALASHTGLLLPAPQDLLAQAGAAEGAALCLLDAVSLRLKRLLRLAAPASAPASTAGPSAVVSAAASSHTGERAAAERAIDTPFPACPLLASLDACRRAQSEGGALFVGSKHDDAFDIYSGGIVQATRALQAASGCAAAAASGASGASGCHGDQHVLELTQRVCTLRINRAACCLRLSGYGSALIPPMHWLRHAIHAAAAAAHAPVLERREGAEGGPVALLHMCADDCVTALSLAASHAAPSASAARSVLSAPLAAKAFFRRAQASLALGQVDAAVASAREAMSVCAVEPAPPAKPSAELQSLSKQASTFLSSLLFLRGQLTAIVTGLTVQKSEVPAVASVSVNSSSAPSAGRFVGAGDESEDSGPLPTTGWFDEDACVTPRRVLDAAQMPVDASGTPVPAAAEPVRHTVAPPSSLKPAASQPAAPVSSTDNSSGRRVMIEADDDDAEEAAPAPRTPASVSFAAPLVGVMGASSSIPAATNAHSTADPFLAQVMAQMDIHSATGSTAAHSHSSNSGNGNAMAAVANLQKQAAVNLQKQAAINLQKPKTLSGIPGISLSSSKAAKKQIPGVSPSSSSLDDFMNSL